MNLDDLNALVLERSIAAGPDAVRALIEETANRRAEAATLTLRAEVERAIEMRAEVERLRAERDSSYPNCRGESAERHKRFLDELNAAHNHADEADERAEQMSALCRELSEALDSLKLGVMARLDNEARETLADCLEETDAALARAQEALREGGGA